MSKEYLTFHKCRVCGCIFYSFMKDTYCHRCVPRGARTYNKYFYGKHVSELDIEEKRKRDRIRWHLRMQNPVFREKERLRSLARARAERKYAKEAK